MRILILQILYMYLLIMSMSFCISVYNFFMFGRVIKELRAEMGITQAKLASILGCSQSMIARWEKGECEPTESVIVKAADTFNVSTDIILGRDYQREPILRASYCVNAKKTSGVGAGKRAWLISKYDSASDDIRKAVDKLLS